MSNILNKLGITNRQISRGKWNKWYPVQAFCHLEASNQVNNVAAGDPVWGEYNSLGIVGAIVNAAGDEMNMLWPFPSDLDHNKKIDMHVVWGHSGTDADSPSFKVGYVAQTDGAALSSTVSATAVSDTAQGTGSAFYKSSAVSFAGGTFARDTFYVLSVEADAITPASADQVYLFGLEIVGTPNISNG